MMPVYTPSGVFSPHYAESKHPMHDENTPQYAYQGISCICFASDEKKYF